MRARASGPQSRFIGSGVTVTGAANVLPRSVERCTTMRSIVGPHDPERAVRREGRRGGERFRGAAGLAVLMLGRGGGSEQDERGKRKYWTHQNLTLKPAIAVSGIPSCGMDVALTVDPSNDVSA